MVAPKGFCGRCGEEYLVERGHICTKSFSLLEDKILDILIGGPKRSSKIAKILNVDQIIVQNLLWRLNGQGKVIITPDSKWSLTTQRTLEELQPGFAPSHFEEQEQRQEKQVYEFTLTVNNPLEDDTILDKLYFTGCSDTLVGSTDGVGYLDFSREASSFADAILTAVQDVESVFELRVERISVGSQQDAENALLEMLHKHISEMERLTRTIGDKNNEIKKGEEERFALNYKLVELEKAAKEFGAASYEFFSSFSQNKEE